MLQNELPEHLLEQERQNTRVKLLHCQNLACIKQFFIKAGFKEEEFETWIQEVLAYYARVVIPEVLNAIYYTYNGDPDNTASLSPQDKLMRAMKDFTIRELFINFSFRTNGTVAMTKPFLQCLKKDEIKSEFKKVDFGGQSHFLRPNSKEDYFSREGKFGMSPNPGKATVVENKFITGPLLQKINELLKSENEKFVFSAQIDPKVLPKEIKDHYKAKYSKNLAPTDDIVFIGMYLITVVHWRLASLYFRF